LWLAVVGVYDQYVNEKIDSEKYDTFTKYLQSHVTRLSHQREERVGGALTELAGEGDNATPRSYTVAISHEHDLQLAFFRHWSLFEAMRHTTPVSCKFKVWTPRGQKRLLEFFAELGIPLTQCKQRFSSMDLEYRKSIRSWIDGLVEKYGLEPLSGDVFVASRGFKSKYAANDVALAIRALLESSDKDKSPNQKFLDAVDGLSWSNLEKLEIGIELAKTQLIATFNQVQHILDMNSIGKAGAFLYTIIKESAPDAKIFSYPGALLSLARYLLNAFVAKTKIKDAHSFPLIIIAPDINNPGTGFVAGIPPIAEQSPRSFFGEAFRQIEEKETLAFHVIPEFYSNSVARIAYSADTAKSLIAALVDLL
jgi:cell division control protein 45